MASLKGLDPARRALLRKRMRVENALSGHQLVASSLLANGITHVYGITGVPVDQTYAACAGAGLTIVGTRHQQAAVLAAIAHNYVTGSLSAVVLVSAGPAITNCTTGLSVAMANRWPLVLISGHNSSPAEGLDAFQALDAVTLLSPLTKGRTLVTEAEKIAESIHWACTLSMQGSPGPVYLDIGSQALQGKAADSVFHASRSSPPATADAVCLQEAAELLSQARRPALLMGKGLRWSEDGGVIDRLVSSFRIPFAASPMGCGFLPDSHALNFTGIRAKMLQTADLVLVVAARMDWVFRFGAEITRGTPVIRIDIDSMEVTKTSDRGVSIVADACSGLRAIIDVLESRGVDGPAVEYDLNRLQYLELEREQHASAVHRMGEKITELPNPYHWFERLSNALPASAISILDMGTACYHAAQSLLPVEIPASRLTMGSNGCLGVGIPFAIGAKLANPSRHVVALCGDFATGLNLAELETVVRLKIGVVLLVINNDGIEGSVRQNTLFGPDYPQKICQFQPGIRYDLIMQDLGGVGIRLTHPSQLDRELKRALDSGQPVLINLISDPEFTTQPLLTNA